MDFDEHCPIPQIDLLVPLGAISAVRGPALADFFLGFLGFGSFEIIFEENFPALIRKQGGDQREGYDSDGMEFHGWFHRKISAAIPQEAIAVDGKSGLVLS